jgi:hypothetical protein
MWTTEQGIVAFIIHQVQHLTVTVEKLSPAMRRSGKTGTKKKSASWL